MLRKVTGILLASFALHASATGTLPKDVRAFIHQRQGCDHMRGEVSDPSDKQRMKELNRDINKLCKETDLRLAGLKRKYSANPAVMRGLNQFEVQIEAGPTQQGH